MRTHIRRLSLFLAPAIALVVSGGCASNARDRTEAAVADSIPPDQLPRFTAAGELARPEGWEAWVLAGTSMGLGYAKPASTPAPGEPPGEFKNVYVQPWAYARFMENGEFPEGTMFALSVAEPIREDDPAEAGFYTTELRLESVHLKKRALDPTGWGFFGFGGGERTAKKIPGEAACYSCHREHGDFDSAFVQFYPAIRHRLALAPTDSNPGGER